MREYRGSSVGVAPLEVVERDPLVLPAAVSRWIGPPRSEAGVGSERAQVGAFAIRYGVHGRAALRFPSASRWRSSIFASDAYRRSRAGSCIASASMRARRSAPL